MVPLPTPATEYAEYENAERLTRQMRYQATPTEELETKELLRRLSLAAGTSLTHSNLMRSCRDLLLQVEDKLVDELRRAKLRRPINDKHAIARFESRLTEAIRAAVRQNPLPYNRGNNTFHASLRQPLLCRSPCRPTGRARPRRGGLARSRWRRD